MLIYAKLVSESYRPVISKKKKNELQNIIRNLSHKPRKPNLLSYDKSRPMFLQKSYVSKSKLSKKGVRNGSYIKSSSKSRNELRYPA